MQGVGLAGNRCLPTTLHELASDYHQMYADLQNDMIDSNTATRTRMDQEEEVMIKLGELQDACPGLFAHRSALEAFKAIESLNLHNGYGLPQRY